MYPETRFLVMTAHGSIRGAVEMVRNGAADYLPKPFEPDELLRSLAAVLRVADRSGGPAEAPPEAGGLDYPSAAMRQLRALDDGDDQRELFHFPVRG